MWLEPPLRRPLSYVIQWHLLLFVKLFWSLRAENEFIVNPFQQVKITLLVLNLNLWRTIHLLRFNSEVIAKGVCILALQWKQCLKATENKSLIFDLHGHRCHNLFCFIIFFGDQNRGTGMSDLFNYQFDCDYFFQCWKFLEDTETGNPISEKINGLQIP